MNKSAHILAPAAVVLLLALALSLLAALTIGGAAAPRQLLDPGAVVRYLNPAARLTVNMSLAIMLGGIIIALWALDPKKPEWIRALNIAAGSAAVLTISGLVTLITTYVDVSSQAFSADAKFGAGFAQFVTEFELGQLWLLLILLAAVTTVLCFAIRSRKLLLVPLITATLTILPLAAQGHAAGASGHSLAVNSMFLHIGGAAVWVGALIAVTVLLPVVQPPRVAPLMRRYSTLALFAAIAVTFSGIVNGFIRLSSPADLLTTGYGQILLLKSAALLLLLGYGAAQRLFFINRITKNPHAWQRRYIWLLLTEIAVMCVASGFSGALGRTRTPVTIEPARNSGAKITPAEYLTGDPLPPELNFETALTVWKFDLLWSMVAVLATALYITSVVKLRRRGDSWPALRTISFVLGMLVLGFVANGFTNAYEAYLFSVHMMGHMLFTMLIPLLLVLAAPVTLLLRVVPKRKDGSWGAREWVLWLLSTPYARLLTNPVVAAALFAGSLWLFYYTPILRWAMESHLGHQWMIVHFLITGYLFSLSLVGVDPVSHRPGYPVRIIILLATMASHGFFGVTLMTGTSLLAADWFGAMGRTWGLAPLADQQSGGGIAWGIGELPTLLLVLIVAIQWARSDEREQKRSDRAAERSGDAELNAYNKMLQQRGKRINT
ncbi:bifunctional copper resistance protein CopD/cytochrome c oxidase assembly protein [Canibacter sp. lx-45]|uniref:cytochrome c oxidase assembly protein n=1 Tax=Canibacter zhuwentaonis TaxID=2837491 RepID=UPI001BDC805F|nr:cytochrome c oxidase assembly protein [Canibacter zhuwentaonis]MBT1035469.1 bifunctional copper resistance protein CopD/cytochrome c oxidase assembly protein [Canibacter zhuwentaonis]